jgi:hypothetical protein
MGRARLLRLTIDAAAIDNGIGNPALVDVPRRNAFLKTVVPFLERIG